MKIIYDSYSKIIEGKKHFFVKKHLRFNDLNNVSDVPDGYGMHTDFKKACSIAGIKDAAIQQKIFELMESKITIAKVIDFKPALTEVISITG
jgi:hypothetical protein